jgi:hypothetical protein
MSKVYMGLGMYNIPNQFSDVPFDSCVEVDESVRTQFEQSPIELMWDGTQLIPWVLE